MLLVDPDFTMQVQYHGRTVEAMFFDVTPGSLMRARLRACNGGGLRCADCGSRTVEQSTLNEQRMYDYSCDSRWID